MNGRPLAIPYVINNVPVILETWHLGSESGNAIADVVFGDYNPSGKLPVSFPYHVGQEPLYYNRMSTGRQFNPEKDTAFTVWSRYTDMPNNAILPFGFGLSYSKFEYSNLVVKSQGEEVKVSVTIKNSSEVAGKETAQVYIHDRFASIVQPVKRLVDFRQLDLASGQVEKVTFTLTEEDLGFHHLDGSFYGESGAFKIMVGTNSVDLLEQNVEVTFQK